MTIDLEFATTFSKKNIDFVIILTKLNELKSIPNLPFDYKIITEAVNANLSSKDNQHIDYFLQSKLFKKSPQAENVRSGKKYLKKHLRVIRKVLEVGNNVLIL